MDTLQNRVKDATLTKKEQIVAEYIINNSSIACFMTATDIAQQLNISDSSIIRLARSLGFSGFNGLKKFIQAEISQHVKDSVELSVMTPSERLENHYQSLSSDGNSEKLLDHSIVGIKEVFIKNSMASLDKAIEILQSSRGKYIMGFRTSATVASVLGFQLNVLTPGVITCVDSDARAIETMVDVSKEDCVVIIAFPRFGKMCRLVHKLAKEKGAKMIVITDKLTSPVANGVDVVLTVGVDSISYFNSVIPATFLVEALCVLFCKKIKKDEYKKRLELINQYIVEDELY